MDLWGMLETLAVSAGGDDVSATSADIERWQQLFDLSSSVAEANINQYRADVFRARVSDEHWEVVSEEKEREGFDREAYEYNVFCHSKRPAAAPVKQAKAKEDSNRYAVTLSGPLTSPEKVREISGLPALPQTAIAESDDNGDTTQICYIDGPTKRRISEWLAHEGSDFKPTFITISTARKELCSYSAFPALGLDTTLPHNRANNTDAPQPAHNQYPVWYFFYGTLGDPECLTRLLDLDRAPEYKDASIHRGAMRTWGGKYRALVDGSGTVEGSAFLVENQAQESKLREYETTQYEVVRCRIQTSDGEFPGLTFRFIDETQLD